MAVRDLYVEHHYKGRFVQAVRLNHKRSRFVLGSGQGSDLRLLGDDISGIHAAFLKENECWKIVDLGSEIGIKVDGKKLLEKSIDQDATIVLGEHELRVQARRDVIPLYTTTEQRKGVLTHQEIILVFRDQVNESFFISKDRSFSYLFDGKVIDIAAAQSESWAVHDYGSFQIRHRLCSMPDKIKQDAVEVDRDLLRALGATVVAMSICLLLLSLAKMLNLGDKPEETKVAQLVFDAKIMQKKRQKAAEVRTRSAGQNNLQNTESDKPAAGNIRVGKAAVSTKVISNIKASGLSQLIGKIAVRAGNTAVAVPSVGDVSQNNQGRGVVAGSTIKGQFETSQSTGYRVSGVATGGKAGGAKGYKDGADMAVGSVGNGEVGVIDEESVIDGGLDREVIAAVIKESLGQIRYCYERHLSADPNLNGKVQVKFTIGAAGLVTAQEIGVTTLKSAMVEGCILRRVARWKFPLPKGGTSVVVTYPFLFKALN